MNTSLLLSNEDQERLYQWVEKLTGTYQQGGYRKEILVRNVERRMQELGYQRLADYIEHTGSDPIEHDLFLSAITIHTTFWFREIPHFELMDEYLKNKNKVSIWSAACSTGEEVYSLALLCEEYRTKNPHFEYRISGSDLDPCSVEKARKAIFKTESLKEIPKRYHRYFETGSGPYSGNTRLVKEIRSRCHFFSQNLADGLFPKNEFYDVIFCRNVLIYFHPDAVAKIIEKLRDQLQENGLLVLGHSEVRVEPPPYLTFYKNSSYQKIKTLRKTNLTQLPSSPALSHSIIHFKFQ